MLLPRSLFLALAFFASNGRVVTFDADQLGRAPSGWIVAMTNRGNPPRWEIRKDESAATQPYVLAQLSIDSSANRAPLAILNDVAFRDGEVSVRMKPISGREDEAGGVVWRYRDENNYYVARADALNKSVAVYKVQNARRIPLLPEAKHDISSNTWFILKVAARGSRFEVYLDHRRILEGRDTTFTGSGKVGLWTDADSVTYFDDFRVYPK
jgi:hypothetical protein